MMEEELKKENNQMSEKKRQEKLKKRREQREARKEKKKEMASKAQQPWFDPDFYGNDATENEEEEDEDVDVEVIGKANVEMLKKGKIGSEQAVIIKRDHPELPGMLKELKQIVAEMENVFEVRSRAIKK